MDAFLSHEDLAPRVAAIAAVSVGLLALHGGGPSSSPWPWAVLAATVVAIALFAGHRAGGQQREGKEGLSSDVKLAHDRGAESGGTRTKLEGIRLLDELRRLGGSDAVEAMASTDLASSMPPPEFNPRMMFIERLAHKEEWLRTDPGLLDALLLLRPYHITEAAAVATIIRMLGESYRRYDQLLNRPGSTHVAHAYINLHDLNIAVLNAVHELHFSRPALLNDGLHTLTHEIQARTTRMLRILRHKYPVELRGTADAVAGGAPRAHAGTSRLQAGMPTSYAVFA